MPLTDAAPIVTPPIVTTFAPEREVSLRRTLSPLRRGYADPTFRVMPDGVWRTLRTPFGPATTHLQSGSGGVTVWPVRGGGG